MKKGTNKELQKHAIWTFQKQKSKKCYKLELDTK